MGKPHSTIFLIKSNITPTERETTVKAEIANSKVCMSWPNSHLSIMGMLLGSFAKYLILFLNIILIEIPCNDIHKIRKLLYYANNKP